MKQAVIIFVGLLGLHPIFAQTNPQAPKFYLGASFGTSYSIGDFEDTDSNNPDAGFASDGTKLDIYGGFFLNEKVTLTGTLRYQIFDTEIGNLIEEFNTANPGASFSGSTEDWQVYYLLVGAAYKVKISKKFSFFPRIGVGPLVVSNPGININAPNAAITQSFNRSSETGFGVGYEIGIGLRTDLGRHFSLMPTFTFGGGLATIPDVVTTTDTVTVTNDYEPKIQSFNLGLSIAYRFY